MFNIVLIGMPGCGKSTIGQELAKKTGLKFFDIDSLIEEKENMKITEIFNLKGEAFFRKLETGAIKNIEEKSAIISTGGGVVETPLNTDILKKTGRIFYLNISPDKIYDRIKNDTKRPLLQTKDPKAALFELYSKRHLKYESAADFIINADRTLTEVTDEIYEKING